MEENIKNKLIGIPFILNRKDFSGCDCRGIVWLYYKYIKNKEYPFSDGGSVFFRNKRNDLQRIINVLKTFANPVGSNEINEGDIVVIKSLNGIGALGVCINDKQILHMDSVVGSCLTKLRYLKELILAVYRPND